MWPSKNKNIDRMEFLLTLRRRGITDGAVLRAMDEVPPDPVPFAYAESAPRSRHKESLEELTRLCEGSAAPERRVRGASLADDLEVPFARRACAVVDWALDMLAQPRGALTFHEPPAKEAALRQRRLLEVLWKALVSGGPGHSADAERVRFCHYVLENVKSLVKSVNQLLALHRSPLTYRYSAAVAEISEMNGTPNRLVPMAGKTDLERTLRHILDHCAKKRYRQLGGTVYRERKVCVGGVTYGTRSWEPAIVDAQRPLEQRSSVRSLVYSLCRKELQPNEWPVAMRNVETFVKYLEESNDPDLPFLERHYHLLGFRGGILDISSRECACIYIPYDLVMETLDPDLNVGKYFDLDLDERWLEIAAGGSWWDVPTPHFQRILDYQNGEEAAAAPRREVDLEQAVEDFHERAVAAARRRGGAAAREAVRSEALRLAERLQGAGGGQQGRQQRFPEEAQRWLYVFLGRLLFPLGAFDNWQVVPFVKGVAGSGKSCLIHAAKSMFEPEDVGVLSSTMFERNFGLSALAFKRVWFCFEVKKHMDLPAAEFQSMISGEHLCVPVKNQTARVVKWSAPGFMVGNDTPEWRDSQGSIRRRLAVFSFDRTVSEEDSRPDLLERVMEELGALIVKVVTAYKEEALRRDRRGDIWARLGVYFHEQRRSMLLQSDPLVKMIWDETQFDLAKRDEAAEPASFVTPWEVFEDAYTAQWRRMRGAATTDYLNEERYHMAFKDAGLSRVLQRTLGEDGVERAEYVVLGIRKR